MKKVIISVAINAYGDRHVIGDNWDMKIFPPQKEGEQYYLVYRENNIVKGEFFLNKSKTILFKKNEKYEKSNKIEEKIYAFLRILNDLEEQSKKF